MRLGKVSMARLPSVKAKLSYNFTSAMVMHPLQTLGLWINEGRRPGFHGEHLFGMGLFSIELIFSRASSARRVLPLAPKVAKNDSLAKPEVTKYDPNTFFFPWG